MSRQLQPAEKARELYESGMSLYSVRYAIGKGQEQTVALLKTQGATIRPPGCPPNGKVSRLDRVDLRGLYESGLCCREIGQRYGVDKETVRYQLQKQGATLRSRGQGGRLHRLPPTGKLEAKLYRQGYSTIEIGASLKVDPKTVRYRLIRAGVKLRTMREALRLAKAKGRFEPGKYGAISLRNYHERRRLMKQVMYFQPIIEEGVNEWQI